jgi:hypothetical protein
MTTNGSREVLPERHGISRWVSPLLTVRVMQVALWLLVVSGPVAAVLLSTHVSALAGRLEVIDNEATVEVPSDTGGAEGFAELFIAAYLDADEDLPEALSPFMNGAPLDGMAGGSWFATRTTSLGVREIAPGYFAVTVAAEVVGADPESDQGAVWVPVGTRFYSVGVVETEAGWVVTSLPTLLPAPRRAAPPELLVGRFDGLDPASGLEEMVARFFAAFLTGDGELARYTAPTSQIVAVQPAPFTRVEILEAGLVNTPDGHQQVAVVVRATDTDDRVQVLEYAFIVEQRDGRWEVSELLPAPSLAP